MASDSIQHMHKVKNLEDLVTKPTLVLNSGVARRNIWRMAKKARENGVTLRPHFKTHQSAEIGQWFRDNGVTEITVSSVEMASYFATHGWKDITIAFPVNLREISQIDSLASNANIGILVESADTINKVGRSLRNRLGVWLKIDVGYGRTGIRWDQIRVISKIVDAIAEHPNLEFSGLLTHAGHTYHAKSTSEIRKIYHQSADRMNHARKALVQSNDEPAQFGRFSKVSVGDTPGCSLADDFGEVDEIRPGNFVFYDLMQLYLGACSEEDIAVAVACPVVAKHSERSQIILYGGAIHLSKEFIPGPGGRPLFGHVSLLNEGGWSRPIENSWLAMLTQEHGVIQASEELFQAVDVGDLLAVIPVHSCLTANLMRRYLTLDGNTISMMPRS